MWSKQESGRQILEWRYSKIIITSDEHYEENRILVTTHPFLKEDANTLVVDTTKQSYKSLETVHLVLAFFIEKQVNRKTTIYIKGGGMLLDLVSFACSIYMRGIDQFIFIPTTLLAMVDATIGGKNGINFANTKNLIGTIRHPASIFINVNHLSTQNDREFFNGMAEVIKIALVYDQEFFNILSTINLKEIRLLQNKEALVNIIKRSLELKMKVVEIDQFEKHQRKWLNYGHTIGHAIELNCSEALLHGECVSIGMVKALQLQKYMGVLSHEKAQKIISVLKKILKSVNLPTEMPTNLNIADVIASMKKDKKKTSQSDLIQFVFIEDLGKKTSNTTKISSQKVALFLSKSIQIKYSSNFNPNVNSLFNFPSSKSISLRLVYMAALALKIYNSKIKIFNFLASDDTACMLQSLKSIGFIFLNNQQQKSIQFVSYTPQQEGTINIGNSGITARFLLPLLASTKGTWQIICSSRMSERPNKEIIQLCLKHFKCEFIYKTSHKIDCFPLTIKSKELEELEGQVTVNGKESSQFISSVMIFWSFHSHFIKNKQIRIMTEKDHLTSESYINMTSSCLQQFQIRANLNKSKGEILITADKLTAPTQLMIEADLSTLSYAYALSSLHQIPFPKILSQDLFITNTIQGDALFYQYAQRINQQLEQNKPSNIQQTQQLNKQIPKESLFTSKYIQLDFNNCTDTFITMAILTFSPFIQNSQIQIITIFNIANQRIKQSNRIHLTIKNLRRVGLIIQEYENEIRIHKKIDTTACENAEDVIFQTASDHRLAMSLAVLSSFLSKKYPHKRFLIDDQKSVEKTFPDFWKYLTAANLVLKPGNQSEYNYKSHNKKSANKNLIIIGNRGSGKTTIGQYLAGKLNSTFIDMDEQITKKIKETTTCSSITELVATSNWEEFRLLEGNLLQEILTQCSSINNNNSFVIATGGGIIEKPINRDTLSREQYNILYLEKEMQHLNILETEQRPILANFEEIYKRRAAMYEGLASTIVTFPQKMTILEEQHFTYQQLAASLLCHKKSLQQGYILCLDSIPESLSEVTDQIAEDDRLATVEFRIDQLLQQGLTLQEIRKRLAQFRRLNQKIDTILTLRSMGEYGCFRGNYREEMVKISKIPTNFLDHEVKYEIDYDYDLSKLILSYHGNEQSYINKLLRSPHQGIKKLCYKPLQNDESPYIYQSYREKLSSDQSICVNLNDPFTRVDNRYQMVVQKPIQPNSTRITTLQQMKLLNQLKNIIR